jgi:hypothetical protein
VDSKRGNQQLSDKHAADPQVKEAGCCQTIVG